MAFLPKLPYDSGMDIPLGFIDQYGPWAIGWVVAVYLFFELRAANKKVALMAAAMAGQIAALYTLLAERLPRKK